ncbi:LacI family transcriptional regulator [Marinobacterium nitratireducens]|uniref:LacI family transcriptional regulator n=1 Tax=Marinobacterium nitratireducens TaxID=518897 RepID=A0A917ZJJ0_9GAMM|nr:LacI family DNA-binding transcriptional regulator [Marinobacterium nitratireducens]GGO84542.1 LacI family transcriptional regulator [Marinobacterium nitratireducens]
MNDKTTKGSARKVTASDVAEKAGVSKWTVSRAFTAGAYISPDSRKRVMKAAEELGYRPNLLARSLTKKRSNMVGLVVDEFANLNILPVLNEVTRQLQRKGYSTMLLNINADHGYAPALLLADQFQVDGVIFLGATLPDEFVHLIKEIRHIPLIVLYRDSKIPGVQVVTTDDYQAGEQLATLLLAQGYRRLGYMAGPPSGSTQLKRLDGFSAALAEEGLKLELTLQAGCYQRQRGYEVLMDYLTHSKADGRVDAIFCENDNLAIGALDALREFGNDADIAIVGFDDIELGASASYNLTTYRQPFERLATEAVTRLERGETEGSRFIAPGQIVLRRSHLKQGRACAPGTCDF